MTDNKRIFKSNLIEQYRTAFAVHGDCPAGVMWPRGRQILRFDALTQHFSGDSFSVLDYGCGLGHLKEYLDQRFSKYDYHGVDLVPEFVNTVTAKCSDAKVHLIKSYKEVSTPIDHVVISGVFNIIDDINRAAYVEQVHSTLEHLFGLARVSLAVNFMTDRVDFMQPDALHMNVEVMTNFIRRKLSPRLRVDESYMPYEFTLVILKNSEIIRPDNIYIPY
jgi:SAM-dependent methyltransferase